MLNGSIWDPESAMEKKKNTKKNYSLMFDFITMENIKEYQI